MSMFLKRRQLLSRISLMIKKKSKKDTKKHEINLVAIIRGRLDDPVFVSLGQRYSSWS